MSPADLLVLQSMAMMGLAPVSLLPWFVVYLVADVMVLSALGMALGAACSSPHDAQQLGVLLLAPVMIPMFLLAPDRAAAERHQLPSSLSMFPPFTPILMMLRQAMPGGVPAWQPWVGLVGVVALDGCDRLGRRPHLPRRDPDAGQAAEVRPARALGRQGLTVLHFWHS